MGGKGLIVVTHNGLMPSQGGRRLAFVSIEGDMLYHLATRRAYSLSKLQQQYAESRMSKWEREGLVYYKFPVCNSYGDCVNCDRQDNPQTYLETDKGEMRVVICKRCQTKMRHR
jgi:hypothetical protein